jgi:ubiquinone/menaquinone biosynthesis C-methylase UbiE
MVDKIEGLQTKRFPSEYRRFLANERRLLIRFIKPYSSVLDAGCGTARALKVIPRRIRYVGIDVDSSVLRQARKAARDRNARILRLDAEKISHRFKTDSFDATISLFSTVGCLKNPLRVLRQLRRVTKAKVFLTVMAKGTWRFRKKYYASFSAHFRLDPQTETVFSSLWGISRAYNKTELRKLCQAAGFKVKNIGTVEPVGLYAILEKRVG